MALASQEVSREWYEDAGISYLDPHERDVDCGYGNEGAVPFLNIPHVRDWALCCEVPERRLARDRPTNAVWVDSLREQTEEEFDAAVAAASADPSKLRHRDEKCLVMKFQLYLNSAKESKFFK